MTKYKIVTKTPDYDTGASDGVIVFPQNRTLYVDQFTDEGPFSDEDRSAFMVSSIEDVFDHYQPQKDIVLETELGELIEERFVFRSINDFEDNQLIEQSDLLSKNKAKVDVFNSLIRQFKLLNKHKGESKYNTKECEQWVSLYKDFGDDETEIIAKLLTIRDKASGCLMKNLYCIHEAVKDLEITYRTLETFFSNTGQGKVDCLTLMNVNKEELNAHDSDDTFAVREELEKYYDRLSLKLNYSILVIPGYLGEACTIRMWADTAFRHGVILVTDFRDCFDVDMLKEMLERAGLQGNDTHLNHVIMTCNYLLGRKKSVLAEEEDDLFIPGSGALAGRLTDIYEVVVSQGVSGMRFGVLRGVKGTRMDLRKAQIATLIDLGVIPLVEEDNHIMAFSNRTLYNGCMPGFQNYPSVRVLDWISKVLRYFINEEAFVNWNSMVRADMQQAIKDFLNDFDGPDKLIESYRLRKIEQDHLTKDIRLAVEIKLHCSLKPYLIELTFHRSDMGFPEMEQEIMVCNYISNNENN